MIFRAYSGSSLGGGLNFFYGSSQLVEAQKNLEIVNSNDPGGA